MNNLNIVYIPIEQLKFAEYNPRKANKNQWEQLKRSLEKFGFVDPVIVNSAPGRENIIIGGHFRVKVAKEMGIKEVPVVYVNIPDIEKEKELNLRLNKNIGEWDWDLLANFDIDFLKNVGFDNKELSLNLRFDFEDDEFDVEKEIEKIKEPQTKLGDLYLLGKHKLLCGDATKQEDVKRLIGDKKIDILLTDPPYGINIIDKKIGKIGRRGKTYHKIINDENTETAKKFYLLCKEIGIEKIIIFGGNYMTDFLPPSSGWIIWDKRVDETSNSFADCELAWTNFKKPARIYRWRWRGMIMAGDRKSELAQRVHPTQKPVGLLSKILIDNSKENDLVFDGFMGSGSTLIACEKINRICYGIELDPFYCDIIVSRWETFTGKKAELVKA